MAYVLGYLYADGSLEDSPSIRGKYVRVTSTDKDRIETIRRLLGSSHAIVTELKGGNHKPRFLLRIGSHALYDSLVNIGLTPRKSLTMTFPSVPSSCLTSFIRGYFDGDGCAYIEMRKNGTPKRLLTIFTCGSKVFLQRLHELLETRTRIKGFGLYKHGSTEGAYQLRYSTKDSEQIFHFIYDHKIPRGLLLQRKYDIFMRYFKMHSEIRNPRLKLHGLMAKK